MRSPNFVPLNLTDYEISTEQGFLPPDPSAICPIPQRSTILGVSCRRFINGQRQLLPSIPATWRMEDCRAAMRVLSFAGHAYVWEVPNQPAATLPPHLAKPWHEVAQRLGRPPVLSYASYASYALDNWRRFDKTKPIQPDNIVLIQNFLGGLDEEWFVVVHIQIEREAGPGLAGLLRAMKGATEDKDDEVLLGLTSLALAQTSMRATLLRMKERCDPYVYYTRAALHPRLEEQPFLTQRTRLQGREVLCRAATTIPRENRRTKLDRALSRRRTRNRPCP